MELNLLQDYTISLTMTSHDVTMETKVFLTDQRSITELNLCILYDLFFKKKRLNAVTGDRIV